MITAHTAAMRHGGARFSHQKSTCPTRFTLGPHEVQIWVTSRSSQEDAASNCKNCLPNGGARPSHQKSTLAPTPVRGKGNTAEKHPGFGQSCLYMNKVPLQGCPGRKMLGPTAPEMRSSEPALACHYSTSPDTPSHTVAYDPFIKSQLASRT